MGIELVKSYNVLIAKIQLDFRISYFFAVDRKTSKTILYNNLGLFFFLFLHNFLLNLTNII